MEETMPRKYSQALPKMSNVKCTPSKRGKLKSGKGGKGGVVKSRQQAICHRPGRKARRKGKKVPHKTRQLGFSALVIRNLLTAGWRTACSTFKEFRN